MNLHKYYSVLTYCCNQNCEMKGVTMFSKFSRLICILLSMIIILGCITKAEAGLGSLRHLRHLRHLFHNEKKNENMIIGNWECSYYYEGSGGCLTISGTQSYYSDGKSDSDCKLKLRIGDVTLRFHSRASGTWDLRGNKLDETVEDINLKPIDDYTKAILEKSPEIETFLMQSMNDGSTTTATMLSISETTMKLQLDDPEITLTFLKKHSINIK